MSFFSEIRLQGSVFLFSLVTGSKMSFGAVFELEPAYSTYLHMHMYMYPKGLCSNRYAMKRMIKRMFLI